MSDYTREQWQRRFRNAVNPPPGPPPSPRCIFCDKLPGQATHRGDPRNFCTCPAPTAVSDAQPYTRLDWWPYPVEVSEDYISIRCDHHARLLATAKQGVESTDLLGELADLADALRDPVALAYDGATTRAAILAKVLDWSDKRHLRGGNQSGVLPAAPPKGYSWDTFESANPPAAAVERGVRETPAVTDEDMMTWSGPQHVFDALLRDRERLDFLIDWLGLHDDLEGSRIRDWSDSADARVAIDEARERRAARSGYGSSSEEKP